MNNSQDLDPAIQEMVAEMATMRAELTGLKARADLIIPQQPVQQTNPLGATTRRKALRKLGGGIVAASLAASVPLFTTSAAPGQQVYLLVTPMVR